MAWVSADNAQTAVSTDHFALLATLFNCRFDLHKIYIRGATIVTYAFKRRKLGLLKIF